jgi:hypothetical protein
MKPVESAIGSHGNAGVASVETVADILERELHTLIGE